MRKLYLDHQQREIEVARRTLSDFMLNRAFETSEAVGFSWKGAPDAPDRYDVLCAAYDHSVSTAEPLPISSEHNDSVIYTSAEANISFRFVHDVNHVQRGLSFVIVDELELAMWHLRDLEREGFEPSSLPWRMLHADLIGQAQLMAITRSFPVDQHRFVRRCLDDGFELGLIAEARDQMDGHDAVV
jgi:hypothetical protein